MSKKKPPMVISCSTHGSTPWGGAVACPICHVIYQTYDDQAPRHAPETCCGRRLMPSKDPSNRVFSAVPVCNDCAENVGVPRELLRIS